MIFGCLFVFVLFLVLMFLLPSPSGLKARRGDTRQQQTSHKTAIRETNKLRYDSQKTKNKRRNRDETKITYTKNKSRLNETRTTKITHGTNREQKIRGHTRKKGYTRYETRRDNTENKINNIS